MKCFVLTSNTEDPEAVINAFVDIFFSSVEGMALGYFGIPGEDFTYADNVLQHKYSPDESVPDHRNLENIRLTGLNYEMLKRAGAELRSELYTNIPAYTANETMLNDLYDAGELFTMSWFLPHTNYKTIQRSFSVSFYQNFLLDMDNVSPADLLGGYARSQAKAGAADILYDLNSQNGTMAKYHYPGN